VLPVKYSPPDGMPGTDIGSLRQIVLSTSPPKADKHIVFQKTHGDNPSLLKSEKNITGKCVCATVRVRNLSFNLEKITFFH